MDPVENTDGGDHWGLSDMQVLLYLHFAMV